MSPPGTSRAIPSLTDDYTAWLVTSLAMRLTRGAVAYYTRHFGLGSPEYRIVMALGATGPGKAVAVAAQADVDKAAASRALQLLVGRGLVAQERQGRESLVALTPEGTQLFRQLRTASRRREKRLLRGLDEARITRLRADLLHLIDNLDHMNRD